MDTISANGQLECVVISVSSLTIEGSPGLLTLIVIRRDCVYNGKRVRADSKYIMIDLKKKLPNRKLFSVGDCRVLQQKDSDKSGKWFAEDFLCGTDLQPLWL